MSYKKVIVLLGFPNTGKTSLFNAFTALNQKTVNYPGATVDISIGPLVGHSDVLVVDTPGLLSLTPRSEDEAVTVKVLFELDKMVKDLDPAYEIVLCAVLDLTQIIRHLAFIKPFLDAKYKLILALNKYDISQSLGEEFDFSQFKQLVSCDVHPVSVRLNQGVALLKNDLLRLFDSEKPEVCLSPTFNDTKIKAHFDWAETVVSQSKKRNVHKKVFDLDQIFLHPLLGPLSFVAVMLLFFYSIFSLAAPLMDGVDVVFSSLNIFLKTYLPASFLTDFLTDGMISGVGSVIIFVPQLFILFCCIGFMEGSGFLARASMLIDKPLSLVGLNGRSFVPLLSGCACAIPALMASRSIPGKKERLLSMFIIPLMQCSARLPVYGLLISLLFFEQPSKGSLFLTGIYVVSICLSCVIAGIGSRLMPERSSAGFQIELPRWQWPQVKPLVIQAYIQTKMFMRNAGPIILSTSVILWFCSVFPAEDYSILMMVGHVIDPVFSPMGVDWRVGVALLMSFVAREVFVSALAIMFAVASDETQTILHTVQRATFDGTATLIFSPASILALIVFFMVSMQCLSTFAVAKQEMKSWKLATFQLVFYVLLGYSLAVTTFQLLS